MAHHVQPYDGYYRPVLQVGLALLALFLGVLVYYFDRGVGNVYFLSVLDIPVPEKAVSFGVLGGPLPEFLHVFAFVLLTCAVLSPGISGAAKVCLCWFALECLFEIGQHGAIEPLLSTWIPGWLDGVPVLGNARDYFARGDFDSYDILAIALGAVVGYFVYLQSLRMGDRYAN